MNDKRQELLRDLIEKFTQTAYNMHTRHGFSFGDFILRKQQISILFFIYEKSEEASVKEIAEFLHVTSGAVTQFVDGLIEKRLVKREENLTDRRGINIKLTESTKKQFNNFKKKYLADASKTFNGLTDKELQLFIKLLKKIETPRRNKN
jgi:DNA-binding MarR family transcriptional regulator